MAIINTRIVNNAIANRRNASATTTVRKVYDPYAVNTKTVNGIEVKYQLLRGGGHLIITDLADEQQAVEVAKALHLIGSQVPRGEWGISKPADIYFRGWYDVSKKSDGWHVETYMPNCD